MHDLTADTRAAIEHLIAEHNVRTDHGRADTLWELFTPEATIDGPFGLMEGQEAIKAWGERRITQDTGHVRHFVGGIHLSANGPKVHGIIYYQTFREATDNPLIPASVGEFHDEYAKVDDHWRIASRTIVPIFGAGNAAAHAQRLAAGAQR